MLFTYLIIKIFSLNLLVFICIYIKVYMYVGVSKRFNNLFFLLFIMFISNFFIIISNDYRLLISLLIFLSFYSMFLILNGYGNSYKVLIVLFFKGFADMLIIIAVFVLLFIPDYIFTKFIILLIFSTYSLIGVFSFWIYWAMDASYFVSSFIHSCGFISIGFILFSKLVIIGVVDFNNYFYNIIYFMSLISYVIFIIFFLLVKDYKKSFGLYSASSVCFLFFTSFNYPYLSIFYFFFSSIIKVLVFDLLYYINKVSYYILLVVILLLLDLFNFSFLFILMTDTLDIYIYLFLIKILVITLFIIKVYLNTTIINFYNFYLLYLNLFSFYISYYNFNIILYVMVNFLYYILLFILFLFNFLKIHIIYFKFNIFIVNDLFNFIILFINSILNSFYYSLSCKIFFINNFSYNINTILLDLFLLIILLLLI